MNQILLISSGLGAIKDFVKGNPQNLQTVFIATAANLDQSPWYVDKDRQLLISLGFQLRELDLASIKTADLKQELSGANVIYVTGGNTFYLLQCMNQSGFSELVPQLIEQGIQYIGASAGAVVAGPDIEAVSDFDDPQDAPGLTSTAGLKLVDIVVIPHINQLQAGAARALQEQYGAKYQLEMLRDDQAIIADTKGNYKAVTSSQLALK